MIRFQSEKKLIEYNKNTKQVHLSPTGLDEAQKVIDPSL